jgi:hypothetical protein
VSGLPNPITAEPGEVQAAVDPCTLRPSRRDLLRRRVEFQRSLIRSGQPRSTPIQVSPDGIIVDGHPAVRTAAEEGRAVDVQVVDFPPKASAESILGLPVG